MSLVKYPFILVLSCISSLSMYSQSGGIIIDPLNPIMYVLEIDSGFIEEDVSFGNTAIFAIDLDSNGINDFEFKLSVDRSATTTDKRTWVVVGDGCFILQDSITQNVDYFDWSNGEVIDTVLPAVIPKAHVLGDSIAQFVGDSVYTIIHAYSGSSLAVSLVTTSYGFGGPAYMAVKKRVEGVDYYGWIKMGPGIPWGYNFEITQIAFEREFQIFKKPPLPTLSSIALYPNPTNDILHFSQVEFENVKVFNQQGGLMLSQDVLPANSEFTIDVHSWDRGVYLVRLESEGNVVTKEFVKY